MSARPIKQTEAEIEARLQTLPEWKVVHGKLSRTFTFDSYKAGLVFGVAVGHLADRKDHHPDLMIGYQRVTVQLSTHDVDGLSNFDFELAAEIDGLV